jgi:hypothetical protein
VYTAGLNRKNDGRGSREHDMCEGSDDMEMTTNQNRPQGRAANSCSTLSEAMDYARRVAANQPAAAGILDPDGAAIWLRFCQEAGLGPI